ncbi:MAG: hypothetical protein JWN89_59 [Parcubacteria group bacterium]|nr:hypothetical protein [Parcubacteria group bacterium]
MGGIDLDIINLMKKIIIAVIVLALVGFAGYSYRTGKLNFLTSRATTAAQTPESSFTPTEIPTLAGGADKALAHEAWGVFQTYLGFLHKHDISGVKTVTQELSTTCADKAKTAECNKLMDSAYDIGSTFKEADFTHMLFDAKQIILSTSFHTETSDLARALVRQVIYFSRDEKGVPKVLSYTFPNEITYALYDAKDPKVNPAGLDARLRFRVNDRDLDGLPDEVEECSFVGVSASCVKTNADKRDTDGDGWWDGVESFIKR